MSYQEKYHDCNSPSLLGNELMYYDILDLANSVKKEIEDLRKLVTIQNSRPEKPLQQSAVKNLPAINTPPAIEQIILDSDLLTGREVMKRLKICKRTLQNYRDAGTITYVRFNGKIYYPKQDIEKRFLYQQITNSLQKIGPDATEPSLRSVS